MNVVQNKLQISHVNIRTSISFLLMKLIVLELLAALFVVLLHAILFYLGSNIISIQILLKYGMPVFIFLVLSKIFFTVYITLDWVNEYYEISPIQIMHVKGIFMRTVETFPLSDIHFLEVYQNELGKKLNYGNITLYNARKLKYLELYQIHNPRRYAEIFEDLVPRLVEKKVTDEMHFFESEDQYKNESEINVFAK